jgi:hypothetical protein
LKRENKRLQADVDLGKRATAFFAKETRWKMDPNTQGGESLRAHSVKRCCELF